MLLLRLIARLLLLGAVGFTVALAAALAATPRPAGAPEGASRILGPVDDSRRVLLGGNIHPAAGAGRREKRAARQSRCFQDCRRIHG